jgi:hypothetical protein
MSRPFLIREIRQICQACPSAFEGATIDGRDVYVKFRYGKLRVEIAGEIVFLRQLSDSLDGVMTYRELRSVAPHMFVFPDECADEYDPAEDRFEFTFFSRADEREYA